MGFHLDAGRLLLQWMVIAVIAGATFISVGGRLNHEPEPTHRWECLWHREWPLLVTCLLLGFALMVAVDATVSDVSAASALLPYALIQAVRVTLYVTRAGESAVHRTPSAQPARGLAPSLASPSLLRGQALIGPGKSLPVETPSTFSQTVHRA